MANRALQMPHLSHVWRMCGVIACLQEAQR
jgi:hypothetical protein